ncbi:hypothetical protein AAMO2058_000527100 [Amorphochlora amoebiformis]
MSDAVPASVVPEAKEGVKMEIEAKDEKLVPSDTIDKAETKPPKDDDKTTAQNGEDAKSSEKPKDVPHEGAAKALEAYQVARKTFLDDMLGILDKYKQSLGLLPYHLPSFFHAMQRDPDPNMVSLARKVNHSLNVIKNKSSNIFTKPPRIQYGMAIDNSTAEAGAGVAWDGIFAVYKPKGWTSADVVRRVKSTIEANMIANGAEMRKGRKGSQMVKVGHGGTLDPIAQGVLVMGVGSGCRLLSQYLQGKKTYEADMQLGEATDTMDSEGVKTESKPFDHVTDEVIEKALQKFRGEIEQVPPMFSALKRDGKPLYKLAREGKTVERKARPVTIYNLVKVKDENQKEINPVRISVECSKGLYVRVLIDDLGKEMGTLAHMADLKRTNQGKFTLKECLDHNLLNDPVAIAKHLHWSREVIPDLPKPPKDSPIFSLNPKSTPIIPPPKVEKSDGRAMRTVCLGGLPQGTDSIQIEEKLKEFGDIENVQMGGKLPADVAYIQFASKEAALKAIANPPKFENDEAGSIRECQLLSDHLNERAMLLLLVLEQAPRDGARKAKEEKTFRFDNTELKVLETTTTDVKAFQSMRQRLDQRNRKRKHSHGGRGVGRGYGHKRRHGGGSYNNRRQNRRY